MDVEEFIKKTEEMNKIKDIDETIRDKYFFLDYSKCVCDILKENQELKKKLEQCSAVADTNSELADSIDEHYKRRQKEFIEWLEQNIENEEYCYLAQNPNERCRKDVFEETLSKYKEIVGGSNANVSRR